MGCHDGVTAVDSHGSAGSNNGGSTAMSASYTDALGNTAKRYITDLTVTHPIGFQYSQAVTVHNAGGNNQIVRLTTASSPTASLLPWIPPASTPTPAPALTRLQRKLATPWTAVT